MSVPFHFTKSSCDGTEFPFHVNSRDSITQVSVSFHFTKSSCDGTEPITTPRGVRLPPRGPRRRDGRGVGRGRGDAPGPSVSLLRVARAIAKGFNSSNGGRWTPPRRGEHAPSVAARGGVAGRRREGQGRAAPHPPLPAGLWSRLDIMLCITGVLSRAQNLSSREDTPLSAWVLIVQATKNALDSQLHSDDGMIDRILGPGSSKEMDELFNLVSTWTGSLPPEGLLAY